MSLPVNPEGTAPPLTGAIDTPADALDKPDVVRTADVANTTDVIAAADVANTTDETDAIDATHATDRSNVADAIVANAPEIVNAAVGPHFATTANISDASNEPSVTVPAVTTLQRVKPPRQPRRRKSKEVPKPIGVLGRADSLGFQEARYSLNRRVPFFQDNHISNIWMKHTTETPDWDDSKSLSTTFPHWKMTNNKTLGVRQIPKCLLLDAQTPQEKLVVLNWWRGLHKDDQADFLAHDQIHRYYRAPMRSNSPYKFCQRVSDTGGLEHSAEDDLYTSAQQHQRGAPLVLTKSEEPPTVLCFRAIRTTRQLVKRFQLSIDQLFCARVLDDVQCCVDQCQYPSLEQNRNSCFLHKQMWWPRTTVEHFQKRRGHFLLGVEYAVRPSKKDVWTTSTTKVHPVPCGCSNEICEGIGWSADTVRMPKGVELPSCIIPNVHCDKDRPLRLAPWHFAPEHRLQLPDGSWKMNLSKLEEFPCPDYDLQQFLKESGMIEYQARKSPWLLPDWVYAMQAREEGPLTLMEVQFRAVWKQRNQLMEGMAWQAIYHQELTQSHQQVNTKLEEMKKTHVHKRKFKKKSNETPRKKSRGATTTDPFMDDDVMSDDEHRANIILANNNNIGHALLPPRPLAESVGVQNHYREETQREGAGQAMPYLQHNLHSQQHQVYHQHQPLHQLLHQPLHQTLHQPLHQPLHHPNQHLYQMPSLHLPPQAHQQPPAQPHLQLQQQQQEQHQSQLQQQQQQPNSAFYALEGHGNGIGTGNEMQNSTNNGRPPNSNNANPNDMSRGRWGGYLGFR